MPLGVLLRDENKLDEMADILDELHKYVPMVQSTESFEFAKPGEETEIIHCHLNRFSHILLGGDQLTVARIQGCQRIRRNLEDGRARIEGLVSVIEDWHAKMCLMKVISNICVLL